MRNLCALWPWLGAPGTAGRAGDDPCVLVGLFEGERDLDGYGNRQIPS